MALRYFKTGPGEYGEGDQFLGISVPQVRQRAKEFKDIPAEEVFKLLRNPIHEVRLCALIILTLQYPKAAPETRDFIFHHYLKSSAFINNWDLVDCSAHKIVGPHLWQQTDARKQYLKLIASTLLWDRRIAVIANFYDIKQGDFSTCFELATGLLHDKQDLIHKAVGWMLREEGKRSLQDEVDFLDSCYTQMPRTMLRYAIEKFPEDLRLSFLKGSR